MYNLNFIKWAVRASLLLLGIFDNRLYSILCCIAFTISLSVSVFGSVIGFINSTKTIDRLESFTAISPQLNTILIFIYVNVSGHNLKHLLSELKGNEDYTTNIVNVTNATVRNKLNWLAVIMITQIFCFTVPVMVFSLRQDLIDDKYSLIIPYWFSCGGVRNLDNTLKSICWKIQTKKLLFAVNTVQMSGVVLLNVVYFAAFSLYIIIVEEEASHLKCIKDKTNTLSKQIRENVSNSFYNANDRSKLRPNLNQIRRDFLSIYKYHQFLNRCLLQTISTWKGFITVFFTNFGINTTLFIFVIYYELNSDKFLSLKIALLGLTLFAMAFIAANNAQKISFMKEEIFNELSTIPWYKMDVKFRKIYLIMLTLNSTSLSVKMADMYVVNLNTFGSMVKAAYSVCNVLLLRFVKQV